MTANSGMNFPGVYTITCTPNGRVYVGQARNIRRRWSRHRWELDRGTHDNSHLQRAWRKYGSDAFVFAVTADLSHLSGNAIAEALDHAERWTLSGVKKPFNTMEAAVGVQRASDELRARLSAERKARWADPEYRARVVAAMTAKAQDKEFQARRGAAISIGKSTPEAQARAADHANSLWADPAHRANMSAKRKANWQDPAYVAQQSASRKAAWVKRRERQNAANP